MLYYSTNIESTKHLIIDNTPVLLVGNCSSCSVNETEINAFPGHVVRFNGAGGRQDVRVDTMVWAQDMLRQPKARSMMLSLGNRCKHVLRFEFQDRSIPDSHKYSTGMMLFLWLTKWTQKPIYVTGFDFAGSKSQTTIHFPGNPMLAHIWKKEKEIAKSHPQWMELSKGETTFVTN